MLCSSVTGFSHPDAIAPYGAFKRSLAAACPDLDIYTDVKDPVVDLVSVIAEEWERRELTTLVAVIF